MFEIRPCGVVEELDRVIDLAEKKRSSDVLGRTRHRISRGHHHRCRGPLHVPGKGHVMQESSLNVDKICDARVPFAIEWLDSLLGGGMYPGDVLLVLCPPVSTGASLSECLGLQMAAAEAAYSHGGLYVAYDNHGRVDCQSKLNGLLPRRPYGSSLVNDRTPSVSMPTGIEGVESAVNTYYNTVDSHRLPSLIIVDTVQGAVMRDMIAKRLPKSEITVQMLFFVRQFIEKCRESRVRGVLFQRLTHGPKYGRGSTSDDSAWCHSLANYCTGVINIEHISADGFGTARLTKCRHSPPSSRVIRFDEDAGVVVAASNDVCWDARIGCYLHRGDVDTSSWDPRR